MAMLNLDGLRKIHFRPGDMAIANSAQLDKKPYTMRGRMLGRIVKEVELLFVIGNNIDMTPHDMFELVEFPKTTIQCYLRSLVISGLISVVITAHNKSNTYTRVKKLKNKRPVLSKEFESYIDTYYSDVEKSKEHVINFIQLVK